MSLSTIRPARKTAVSLFVVAALAAALAGCSSSGSSVALASGTPVASAMADASVSVSAAAASVSAAQASVSAAASSAAAASAGKASAGKASAGKAAAGFPFVTPSGNIACTATGDTVRCDIKDHVWPLPPKPASCEGDYGFGLTLDEAKPAEFVCAGDTVFAPDHPVLAYGKAVTHGDITCTNQSTGLDCTNSRTTYGFRLSKEAVKRG